ncbi:TonB-dependent receptor [Mangrovimicrobium sediminis]|uniref:TonB-dependent receptor n=1 Tax=Mangrovimicrobium sediminis TaxID=2562682 RepID=UPI0014367B39|nr:TonB-dependent receptor [Haliea sp. SAOS-164]
MTARRREEALQDIPIAVTALSAEFLREQNITELQDLGTHVPAMRISDNGISSNAPIVTLRGQRPSEVLLTLDPAVPMYFAEVVLTPTFGTNLALYDLANVQVLKGPQGTLFGRNSTGGALLFTPRTPGAEFGGYLQARMGNYDLLHVEGAVDIPVGDSLALRLAGRSIDRDGYQSNVADNPLACDDCLGDEDSRAVRLTVEYSPTGALTNLTTMSYDENNAAARINVLQAWISSTTDPQANFIPFTINLLHNGGLSELLPMPGIPTEAAVDAAVARQQQRDWQDVETDINPQERIKNWFFANTTEWEFSENFTLKNIFGYRELDMAYSQDADGVALPLFGAVTSTTQTYTPDPPLQQVESEQYSNELQLLSSAFDDRLEWMVGAYWMRMEGSDYQPSMLVGANSQWPEGDAPIAAVQPLYNIAHDGFLFLNPNIDVVNEAWAVFGEGTFQFNDQWSVTAGARQSWDYRELTTRAFRYDPEVTRELICDVQGEDNQVLPNDACSRTVDEDYSDPTWRLSVSYTPSLDHLVYGSISTGYRAGGFNGRGANNFSLRPYDPETVTTYELGFKGDWQLGALGSLRTNIAAYLQEYQDIQKTQDFTADGAFGTAVVNAAKAEIQGAELEFTWAPGELLQLSLAYAWVDPSYDEWILETAVGTDDNGDAIIEYTDNSGAPFVYIPEQQVTGELRLIAPLDPALGTLSFVASFYWQDEMIPNDEAERWPEFGWSAEDLAEVQATAVIDDYALWNLRLDWSDLLGSGLDVGAYINNVADEAYVVGGKSVPEQLGFVDVTYGTPRVYGMVLRYNF